MERFIALKKDRNPKVPQVSEFISNLDGDKNAIFYKVANNLHITKNLNPTYAYISYQDIIELSPLTSKDKDGSSDFYRFSELNPKDSYRWLYIIFSLASRTISEDKELESAKLEYFYNAFYNFVMDPISPSEQNTVDDKNLYYKSLKNRLLFLSALFCTMSRLIAYSNYVTDQMKSSEFSNKLLYLLNTNLNQLFDQQNFDVPTRYQDFSAPEIYQFCSPLPENQIPISNLFFDLDIYMKYSISRFLMRFIKFISVQDIQSFKDFMIQYYDHYILGDIARKCLILLFNNDEKQAALAFDVKTLEHSGKIILEFASKTNDFENIIQKDELKFSSALSTIYYIAKNNPESLISFFKNNNQVAKSIENLLCCRSNNYYFKIPAAKILSRGKHFLSNFKVPLLLLILSPSAKLKESIADLLLLQGEKIVPDLLSVLPSVPHCGSKSGIFFKFIASLLPTISNSQQFISALLDILKTETTNIYSIPNANLYSQILKYIKPQHSFFDPQVCQTCLDLEKPFSNKEIVFGSFDRSSISCDTDKIYVKLSQPTMIKSFKLSYSVKNLVKTPRSVLLLLCSDEIKDIKGNKNSWKKKFEQEEQNYLYFSYGQKHSKIKFHIPIYVTGFALIFEKFWQHKDNSDQLFDYRCHNIKTNSVFCPECGSSTSLDLKINMKAGVAFPFTNVCSKETCEEALRKSNQILEDAEKDFHSIISLRDKVESILTKSMMINEKTSQLNDLYNDQCVTIYKQMTISLQRFCEIRIACGKYTNKQMEFNYINHPFQNALSSNSNDDLSESVNICFHCRYCFIKNCLNFFNDLQKSQIDKDKKDDKKISLLKSIYDNFDISSILLNYITDDSLFSQFAINAMISFCKSIPELTLKINDIFISALPNVSPQLVRLLCEIEHINDKYRSYRFTSILPSLSAAASFMNSQSKFVILVLQPLVSTITKSPILIQNPNVYKEFLVYNEWRKMVNKAPSKLIVPLTIIKSQEVLTSLLFDCQSESVRSSIKDVIQCSSKLSDELFKQIYDYSFGLLTDSKLNDIQLSSRQYFDQILSLFREDKIRRHLLLNGFFDKIVNLINNETEKMLKQEDDSFLYYDDNTGFTVYVLMQFVDLFVKPTINLRYVIYRKQTLVVNIITNYFKLRSIIFQKSKYLYDSLALMKDMILRIMQENFVLLSSKKTESENKKEKNNDENSFASLNARYGIIRGGRGGRGAMRGGRGQRGGRGYRPRGGFNLLLFDDYDESPPNSDDNDMDSDTYNDNDNDNDNSNANNNSNNNNIDDGKKDDDDEDIIVPNPNGPKIMIEAAVDAISFCPDIVIKEISSIIFPQKKVESIPIILKKWRNQEDYLPGQLPRDFIMSDQIGKTFRDVREKFIIMLSIQESMTDENFLELMVNNNIIGLDLPIISVYKHVWVPARGETPMEVYCRLTGLDGEATENMVNSLPVEEVEKQSPEEKYAFTTILCDCNGFTQLFKVLDSYGNADNKQNHLTRESLSELVKLLETFILVKRNRVEMNKLNGTNSILVLMKKLIGFTGEKGGKSQIGRTSSASAVDMAMSVSAKAAKQAKTITTKEIFRQAIMIASSLISEDPMCTKNPEDWVKFILGSLQDNFFRRNDTLISPFLSLLPPTAARSRDLMEQVLHYFSNMLISQPESSPQEEKEATKKFNIYENCKSLYMLNGFAEFVLVIPANSLGNTIRDLICEEPFVIDAVTSLLNLFPPNEPNGRLSKKWQDSVNVVYLPSILKILVGMSRCHEKTQKLFLEDDSNFLKLLIELEAITSKANIGELTSDILHSCEEEPSFCKAAIESIRNKKKEEAKKKAQAEKNNAINIAKNISPELQAQLAELTEQSFECVICHEGYEFLPEELLGVYAFVNTSQGSSSSYSPASSLACSNSPLLQFVGNSATCLNSLNTNFFVAFNTATYFVCVHPSCHNRATASEDRRNHQVTFDAHFSSNQELNNLIMSIMLMSNGPNGDKAPHYGNLNQEWESASLRNSERPCNAIFPLPSSTLQPGAYKKALLNYIENFNGGSGSSSSPSKQSGGGTSLRSLIDFRSIFIDLRTHLVLTSIGEKIPIQLGGGSFSSITALWPFLINAGHIVIDMNAETSQQQKQPTAREELERELTSRLSPLLKQLETSGSSNNSSDNNNAQPGGVKQIKKDGIADLFVLSIWILSIEEWDSVKKEMLKLLLYLSLSPKADECSSKKQQADSDQQEQQPPPQSQTESQADSKPVDVFEKTRSIFVFYTIIDRIQSMVKKPTGKAAARDEEGCLVVGPHNAASEWLKEFTDRINDEPAEFQTEWSDFGEELKDEILEASDLKTLIAYAQVPSEEFDAFIKECINK